jgi:hypothetical protein
MIGTRFDDLVLSLTESRRTVLGGALTAAAGWLGVAGADAKKRRHKRRKRRKNKPRLNKFGCVDVGGKCFGKSEICCSGICEGTGKTSQCVAHNELGCAADETCSESVPCGTEGVCYKTTGKAAFCGNNLICHCLPCQKDSDCEADSGPGAACVVCSEDCNGVMGSQGTACVPAAA